jgi:hypothetical protein
MVLILLATGAAVESLRSPLERIAKALEAQTKTAHYDQEVGK